MAATETKTSLKIGLDQVRIAEAEQTRALASLDKENSRAHHEITRELLEARSEARQGHAVLTERVDKIDTRVHAIEEDKK